MVNTPILIYFNITARNFQKIPICVHLIWGKFDTRLTRVAFTTITKRVSFGTGWGLKLHQQQIPNLSLPEMGTSALTIFSLRIKKICPDEKPFSSKQIYIFHIIFPLLSPSPAGHCPASMLQIKQDRTI